MGNHWIGQGHGREKQFLEQSDWRAKDRVQEPKILEAAAKSTLDVGNPNQGSRGKTRPEQNPEGGEGFGEEKSLVGKTRMRNE
jgi:hypothetical protein